MQKQNMSRKFKKKVIKVISSFIFRSRPEIFFNAGTVYSVLFTAATSFFFILMRLF